MSIFVNTLWPDTVRSPLRRLLLALIASPVLVAALLTAGAYAIAGMTESSRQEVITYTVDAAIVILPMMFIFTLTFGLIGIFILWWLVQRGVVSWVICGAVMGVIAGISFGELLMNGVERGLLAAFAVTGILLFTFIRAIAGVSGRQETRRTANPVDQASSR
ncbi:MAG: hypothetical protein AAF334_04225 [Pseudomonadota bacterium]